MVVVRSHHRVARAAVAAHPPASVSAFLVAFASAVLTALVALLLAAAAQAYAPGELIWAQRVGTSEAQTDVRAMAGGPKGAVAIAGWQNLAGDERVPLVAKYGIDGLEWVKTYEGRGEAQAVAFDRSGNVYVAATVASAQYDYDIVLTKYDEEGAQQWTATLDGPGTYGASARHVAVDRHGDIIVVGTEDVIDDAGRFNAPAVVVLKYDADGTPVWPATAVYEPAAGDASMRTFEFSDAALDTAGDVYVSGGLLAFWWGVDGEMAGHAIKVSGADGALVASRTDACPPGTESQFASIAVRGSTVAIAGMTLDMTDYGGIADAHGLVATFDLALQDVHRRVWDPGETKYETFNDVELDARGDVYVTGSQAMVSGTSLASEAVTLRLDSDLATVRWSATYAPKAAEADSYCMARDANGDVYVAGVQRTGAPADWQTRDSQDFLTIKYGRTGALAWVRTWSGGGPGWEGPRGLVLGARHDVFVGGHAWTAEGGLQAAVMRYKK